jgi:cysteine synthase A
MPAAPVIWISSLAGARHRLARQLRIAESIVGQMAKPIEPLDRSGRHRRLTGDDRTLPALSPSRYADVCGRAAWRRLCRRPAQRDRDPGDQPTLIEGIGRPAVEPGFLFEIADRVCEIDDAASISAAWLLESLLGRRYGGSSGTNLIACLQLAAEMRERAETGSIVTLLCDRGERYAETLFDADWLGAHGIALGPWRDTLRLAIDSGEWKPPEDP